MRALLPTLWCMMALSGCGMVSDFIGGGSTSEAPTAGGPQAMVPPPAVEDDAEAVDDAVEYVYNPVGKRDPFRSFLAMGARTGDDTPRTPLQKYEIDQYVLVGIIWGIDRPRAMVEDPDGVGHVMETGTYIGKNWGKVTRITATEVVVTEEYQTIRGELVVNNISLGLPDTLEGGR